MSDEVTIGEIGRSLQRLEVRLDVLTGDHESRLRSVERWIYAIPPTLIIAAVSVIERIVRG